MWHFEDSVILYKVKKVFIGSLSYLVQIKKLHNHNIRHWHLLSSI